MASTRLYRTFGAGNRDKWTFSAWLKWDGFGGDTKVFSSYVDGSNYGHIEFTGYKLSYNGTPSAGTLTTNRVFRDPTAWYNIQVIYDSGNATSGDRIQMWVNGVRETSFSTETYPSQDQDGVINSAQVHAIGARGDASQYWGGEMSHVHFADGQAYPASTFGEIDATSGIWVAKTSPTVTYGTNGFFLKFASGASGTDSSGETNDFTVSGNLTNTKDTPDNNMSTLYPDIPYPSGLTMTNGNTSLASTATQWAGRYSTQRVFSGKYYVEAQFVSTGHNLKFGVQGADPSETTNWSTLNTSYAGKSAVGYEFQCNNGNGYKVNNNSSPRWTESDFTPATSTIMMAFDLDNGKIWWGRNGTWFDSGGTPNPATGTDAAFTGITTANGPYLFGLSLEGNGSSSNINFGNGYYATTAIGSSVTANEGTWAYAPPTGFGAVNTNWINTF